MVKQVHFAPKLVLESPAKKSVPVVPWVPSLYFGAFRTSVDFSDAHSFSSFTVLPPDDAPAELSSSSSPATLRSALKKMACSDYVHSSPPLADALFLDQILWTPSSRSFEFWFLSSHKQL